MISIGSVPRLGTFKATFELGVSDVSPANHLEIFYVTVEDGEFRSVSNHFRIAVNVYDARSVETLSTSKLKASVTDEGNIGFPIASGDSDEGDGFQFVDKNGQFASVLYEGGLLIGTGQLSLVDCIRGEFSGAVQGQNEHFELVPGTRMVKENDGLTTGKVSVEIQDSGVPNPLGLRILQESYVDDTPENEDFLVLHYTVTNTNEDRTLNGMWVGLFLDWDVDEYASDSGVFDEHGPVGMIFDRSNTVGGVGVKVLTNTAGVSYELVTAAITLPSDGGYSNAEKWRRYLGALERRSWKG